MASDGSVWVLAGYSGEPLVTQLGHLRMGVLSPEKGGFE